MKINPYFYFNGEAAEAIALYEKAFGGKAVVLKYKDIALYDKSYAVPQGKEEFVMHANMNLGSEMMMFCDMPEKVDVGQRVQLMVSLASVAEVSRIFDVLKEDGKVIMEPQKTFWSDCFASVEDRFGVCWLLSYENEQQAAQKYGE